MNLERLLNPRSVAIVGASADPTKISGMIVEFLRRSGFAGMLYPVNPRYQEINGLPCYPSVDALPETVDIIVCAIPVTAVFNAIESAARRGVPFCVLMTGGFGEGRSGQAGQERRTRLEALCRETGMHVVGPNTVGMVNFRYKLPLTFADWYSRDTGQRGGVAIVTHSGSVGGLIFSALQLDRIGVDYWLGLGNEATLEVADFINHFSDDASIHTVICYIEGVRDGRNFLAAAQKARSCGKRVVIVKAGSNPETLRSTASHTCKTSSPADIYRGVFRQYGIVNVLSLAELGYAMSLLTAFGDPPGAKVGILSASGGACSLIADHVLDAGLQLPLLSAPLQAALDRCIPEYGASHNPVDLSADVVSRPDILQGALQAIGKSDEVDIWMVFGRPIIDRYADMLIAFTRDTGKPLIACTGVPVADALREKLQEAGIAVLLDPQLCMNALGRLAQADGNTPGTVHAASTPETATQLHITIENDADFGPIVTLAPAVPLGMRARVVRALPASEDALTDMVAELGHMLGGLPGSAAAIERALTEAVRSGRGFTV